MSKSLVLLCQEIVTELYEENLSEDQSNDIMERAIGKLSEKVDNYVSLYRYINGQIDFLKTEIESINEEKVRLENTKKRLKNQAHYGLNVLDADKIKGERGSVIYRKRSTAVDVFDENQLPEEFFRVEIKKVPNKEAIKKAIDSGLEVPGARLVENESVVFK